MSGNETRFGSRCIGAFLPFQVVLYPQEELRRGLRLKRRRRKGSDKAILPNWSPVAMDSETKVTAQQRFSSQASVRFLKQQAIIPFKDVHFQLPLPKLGQGVFLSSVLPTQHPDTQQWGLLYTFINPTSETVTLEVSDWLERFTEGMERWNLAGEERQERLTPRPMLHLKAYSPLALWGSIR
jgi:hypothetical protein